MGTENSEKKNEEVALDSKTASKKGIPEKTK